MMRLSRYGNTATEYGIAIGLVGVLGVAALYTMGGSISQLLGGSGAARDTNTMSVLQPVQQAEDASATRENVIASSNYVIVEDAASGAPVLTSLEGASQAPTNATSLDGNLRNTLGTALFAERILAIAEEQDDPEVADYLRKISHLGYFLAGAEGELDDVEGLGRPSEEYSNGDALRDVIKYRDEMKHLLSNPPAGMDQALFMRVAPMAADTVNIADKYVSALSKFIDKNGNVPHSFVGDNDLSGDGSGGSCLKKASNLVIENKPNLNVSYDKLVSIEELRVQADTLLRQNQIKSVDVKATVMAAQTVSATADSLFGKASGTRSDTRNPNAGKGAN